MAKRRREPEEHENSERWLVSYADFITLLFAFFVVMYSISRVDNRKLAQTASAIRWAMHLKGSGGSAQMPVFEAAAQRGCMVNLGAGSGANQVAPRAMEKLRKKLEERLRPFLMEQKLAASVVVTADTRKLTVRLAASRFFDPSSAALRPEALPVLDVIADELAALDRPIRIEGHTDDAPFTSTQYRNNWGLSSARAAMVVAFLEEAHHIPPEYLTAVGFGSARPLVPNDTAEHRELNRRVEIAIEMYASDALDVAAR